jgi:hypothetical protein
MDGRRVMDNEIGKFTFEIAPEALRQIIASGRLTEYAAKAAAHAAFQVNAQVVDLVSKAALDKGLAGKGISGGFSTIFEGGDFGSGGPHVGPPGPIPHHGVVFGNTALSQVIATTGKQLAQ